MKQQLLRRGAALASLGCALLLPWTAAGAEDCPPLRGAQNLLDCVKLRHPDLLLAGAEREIQVTEIQAAGQGRNPELEGRILFGVGDHDSPALSEANLLQALELGGKRKARVAKARADLQTSQARARLQAEEIVLTTVLQLHRLRQLRTETRTLRETASTYGRIVQLYRGRSLLSPEQESSLAIFESARSETRLRELQLKNEEQGLLAELSLATGENLESSRDWLPAAPKNWPVRTEPGGAPTEGSALQEAGREVEAAQTSRSLAESEAWPTLRIGPSVETDSPLGNTQTAVGLAFSTELPLFYRNRGGKARALQEERLAKLRYRQTEKRVASELRRWEQEYDRNRAAWLRASHGHDFASSHRRLEALFDRGLISGTLLLEAHRQMIEFERELHRTELQTLEAWWRLLALEGKILEAKI